MQMLQECAERRSLRHHSEGVDIFGEALATIAVLAIGAGDVGVGVVDVT